MAKKRRRNIQGDKLIISGRELMQNSANKESSHMPHVRTGCGFHEAKKYTKNDRRKGKIDKRDY